MKDYFVNAPQKNGLLRDCNSPCRLKAGAANVYPITGWTQSGNVFTLTTNGTSTAALTAQAKTHPASAASVKFVPT